MQIFYIVFLYLLFVWVLLRLVVPYMGFKKTPITDSLPEHLKVAIEEVKTNSQTQRDALQHAYAYIVQRYHGNRVRTVLNFWRAFGTYENKSPGFLPCNMQNQLLRTILVKSGYFNDADITIRHTPLNLFIHQYLEVKVDGYSIAVDPWSHFLGLELGKKSSWFG